MKNIISLCALLIAFAMPCFAEENAASPEQQKPSCCLKAEAKGKTCRKKCCREAAKEGKVCEKCLKKDEARKEKAAKKAKKNQTVSQAEGEVR